MIRCRRHRRHIDLVRMILIVVAIVSLNHVRHDDGVVVRLSLSSSGVVVAELTISVRGWDYEK